MTPFERAMQVYQREPCARTFQEDLSLHLFFYHVICTPEVFLMGRPVDRHAPPECILDPTYQFNSPDAWLIWLAAGNLRDFPRYLPYPLGHVGWQRDNVLRWYPTAKVLAKIAGMGVMRGNGRPDSVILPPRSSCWARPDGQGRHTQTASTAPAACTYASC